MPIAKRDHRGAPKGSIGDSKAGFAAAPRNGFTSMFEGFRDELDDHHARRERIVKVSRDVTALSKKIIFTLQRVRFIRPDLPADIERDINSRLSEISILLSAVTPGLQGLSRNRYARSFVCIEELVEALTFAHYLRTQALMSFQEATEMIKRLSLGAMETVKTEEGEPLADPMDLDRTTSIKDEPAKPSISLTEEDYLMGIFDLSGEMMRFATTTAALTGKMATSVEPDFTPSTAGQSSQTSLSDNRPRTIVGDIQAVGSLFEMLPRRFDKSYQGKMDVLRTSVRKVERLGYGMTVRGSERPAGWMPDTSEDVAPDMGD